MGEDRGWMEEHVLKGGDLLVYGRLAEEMEEIPQEVVWRELRAAAEKYLAGGEERTEGIHQAVDVTIEELVERDRRFGYPAPFCHKGCANCCHEVVYCTEEEARKIYEYCGETGIEIDRGKLERQLKYVETDERLDHTGVTRWNDQPEEDQGCVFLDEAGVCRIWKVRPLVCRAHLAEGTDKYCRPHNGAVDPRATGINYIELSYVLTAIFSIHRDSIKKTMGRLLLAL